MIALSDSNRRNRDLKPFSSDTSEDRDELEEYDDDLIPPPHRIFWELEEEEGDN
jgi:hypothetical protein